MLKLLKITCLLFFPLVIGAQELSKKGRFSVEASKGCAPFTVDISELDTFGVVTRTYFYANGASSSTNLTFTYSQEGVYELVQVVGVDAIPDKTDTILIEVVRPQPPQVLFSRCRGLGIFVKSNDVFYDSVRIYFTPVDSVTLSTNEVASFNYLSNQPQVIAFKGIFNNAEKVCETYFEEVIPAETLIDSQILSASIKESCKDQYALYLTLDQIDELSNYRISIDQSNSKVLFEGKLDSTTIILGDIPFEIADFCIYKETISPCANEIFDLKEFCGTPNSLSLSPFETLYSSYEDSSIYINLDRVNSGSFEIQRRFEGTDFSIRISSPGSISDRIGSNGRKYYYKINYIDSCGSTLYSAKTNPPLISATKVESNNYQIDFEEAVNALSTPNGNTCFIGSSRKAISNSNFNIQLSIENGIGKQFIFARSDYTPGPTLTSNTLALKYDFTIHAPNAFTPNGDGINDTLNFYGLPADGVFLLRIYSRLGQLLFESNEIENGWDGSTSRSSAPAGTYLYEITFENGQGLKFQQKGTFVLIKK